MLNYNDINNRKSTNSLTPSVDSSKRNVGRYSDALDKYSDVTSPYATTDASKLSLGENLTRTERTGNYLSNASEINSLDNSAKSGDLSQSRESEEKTEAEKTEDALTKIADTMTEDDLAALEAEGFSIEKMTAEQMQAAIERIKLQRELTAESYKAQGEAIKETGEMVRSAILKSFSGDPRAEKILKRLENANIPVSKETVEAVLAAMDSIGANGKTVSVSESDAEYMITHKLRVSIDNVAAAKSLGNSYARKEKPLSEETWNQLKPAVVKLLSQAGIKADKSMLDTAKTFIRKDIPLTSDNMLYYTNLRKVSLSSDEVMEKAVDALTVGNQPGEALLSTLTAAAVKQTIEYLPTIADVEINYANTRYVAEDESVSSVDDVELSLSDLIEAKLSLQKGENLLPYQTSVQNLQKQGVVQAANIKAWRQLEEIKTKLTFESGYRLSKQGISIDTEKMTNLVSSLKELEDGVYTSFFKSAGVPMSNLQLELLKETTEKVNALKESPMLLISQTESEKSDLTLEELYQTGKNLEETVKNQEDPTFKKFYQTYESVMTTPRKDLGDNLEKAFGNIDPLITGAGLEANDESRRAVRILAYSSMEITKENIEKMENYDSQLRRVLDGMHPAVTVRMIRDNMSPLSETLDTLEQKISDIKENEGISEEEKFSNFLVNLEKNKSISDKERTNYIGIYRALHQIENSSGTALGSVIKANEKITLKNLQKAVKNGHVHGFDVNVDDKFGESLLSQTKREKEENARKVDLASSSLSETAIDILKKIGNNADNNNIPNSIYGTYSSVNGGANTGNSEISREMNADLEQTPREVIKETVENIKEMASDSTNTSRFLDDYKILPTIENLGAARALLDGDTTIFKELKRILREDDADASLPDFTEGLESKEKMQETIETFANKTLELKKQMYASSDTSPIDLKALKSIDVGIRFMRRLSKREFFQIPIDTGEDITSVNVTVVHNATEKGKVVVEVPDGPLGKVTAEAVVKNKKIKCFISSDTKDGTKSLKDRQLNLLASFTELGLEGESIFYGTDEREKDTYLYKTDGIFEGQGSSDTSTTSSNDLYRVAKAILIHVKNAENA